MDDRNPYAPSRATLSAKNSPLDTSTGGGVWRDGPVLVTVLNGELPDRCVKCNEPADEPTKPRKVYWHHPAIYILALISIPIYAIVALIVRKRAAVPAGLCVQHKKRRQLGLIIAWGGFLVGTAAFLLLLKPMAEGHSSGGVLLLSFLLMLVAIIVGARMARVVYARKIDKEYSWLKGCGPEFLDSLPPFPF